VPSHRMEYLEKAFSLAADVLVFDLEDGVPAAHKESGRENLRRRISQAAAADRRRSYVRVNAAESELRKDLRLLDRVDVAGVVVPKLDAPRAVRSRMKAVDRANPGGGRVALIESFRALAELPRILDSARWTAVGLGLEDMFAETDLRREESLELTRYAQLRLVIEARGRDLPAIDSVSLEYRSLSRFTGRCAESRSLGFTSMFSIHPRQIDAINAAFSPRRGDILWARRIARLTSMENGSGYSRRGGEVLGPPKIRKARRILGEA